MSTIYIGRTTYYSGKRLMDILCRLNKFGIGRIVYRKHFFDKYEEPCFYVITKADPDMANPSSKNKDKSTNTHLFGKKIFNGEDLGEKQIDAHWKWDWRLVPKTEESDLLKYVGNIKEHKVVIDKYKKFPPLLEHILKQKLGTDNIEGSKTPMFETTIRQGDNNRAVLSDEN